MATFYRWSQPAWFGATTITPSTVTPTAQDNGIDYLFLNVKASGVGSGTAPVGGQVPEGSNRYTFMVALGEDATSSSVNRAIQALAANTDIIDDSLNEDRVHAVRLMFEVAVDSDTITLPAGVYMGPVGSDLTLTDNLINLFILTDEEGIELVVAGDPVRVQSCSESTSPGYSAGGETITFTQEIPANTYYLLSYAPFRLSDPSEELWRVPLLPALASVSGQTVVAIAAIHGDGLSWGAPPPASLRTLVRRGLQGIYANGTSVAAMPSLVFPYYGTASTEDVAGSGAVFSRTGPAMAGLSETDMQVTTPLKDPLGAVWLGYLRDTNPGNGTSTHAFVAGSRSFVSITPGVRHTDGGSSDYAPALAHFAAFLEHSDTYGIETNLYTKIQPGAAATVQRVAGLDALVLDTGGDDWFAKSVSGTTRTGLVVGSSLIEVEWINPSDPLTPASSARRMYRIQTVVDVNTVYVMGVDGTPVNFPASLTAATVRRVLTPTFLAGSGFGEFQSFKGNGYADSLEQGPLFCVVPPLISVELTETVSFAAAYFGASARSSGAYALSWGGYESNIAGTSPGRYLRSGHLRGDGSLYTTNIVAPLGTVTSLTVTTLTATTATATTLNATTANISTLNATTATLDTAVLRLVKKDYTNQNVTGTVALNVSATLYAKQVALVTSTGNTTFSTITLPAASKGYIYEIWFDQTSAGAQISSYTTTWPSTLKFDSEADKLLSGKAGYIDRFIIQWIASNVGRVTVERTKVS